MLTIKFSHRREFDVFIGGNTYRQQAIRQTDLLEFPQFLRFDEVEIYYCYCYATDKHRLIEEKCKTVVHYLQLLKKQLNDSYLTVVCALEGPMIYSASWIVQNDGHYFSNHSHLLDHIQNELLPVCGSSFGYKFDIDFHSEKSASTNVIASILQMTQIERCSTLQISLNKLDRSTKLPVESISNWLHRKRDGTCEKSKRRFLRIYLDSVIQNALEMCDYLKKVIYLDFRVG